jgi:hypothetical protein
MNKTEIVIIRTTSAFKELLRAEATKRSISITKLIEMAFLAFIENEDMK